MYFAVPLYGELEASPEVRLESVVQPVLNRDNRFLYRQFLIPEPEIKPHRSPQLHPVREAPFPARDR